MHVLVIDFETTYGQPARHPGEQPYTLSSMTTEAYVRDPRFQTIGVGIRNADNSARVWLEHDQFKAWAAAQDWSQIAVIAHHAHSDGLILSHHYGVRPGFWFDTLSMANALRPQCRRKSLAKLAEYEGLGAKGDEVILAKGKRREDFTPAEWAQYGVYCLNDCDLEFGLYDRYVREFPLTELRAMDITVRMFTEPCLTMNTAVLEDHHASEIERKRALIERCAADKDTLMSNDKFAQILMEYGVQPPQKLSEAKTKSAQEKDPNAAPVYSWAFAKTDPGMKSLLEHEDPEVRALVEARVGVKSSQEETRAKRFVGIVSRGLWPVYLHYAKPHTWRWSGGDKANPQNLKRGGILRDAIEAPSGHKVVVSDSAQIEARKLAYVACETWLIKAFAEGRDVYSEFASEAYQRPVNRKRKVEVDGKDTFPDFIPGFVGKTCLEGNTLVLCASGWKPLVSVNTSDRVWDGQEWVCHQGVVSQGSKEVLNLSGVWLTADHLVLCGRQWCEAQHLARHEAMLSLALETAAGTSPLQVTCLANGEASQAFSLFAPVGGPSTCLTAATTENSDQRDVTRAQRRLHQKNATGNTARLCLTTSTVPGSLTAYLRQLRAAIIQAVNRRSIMVSAASRSMMSGVLTALHSFGMSRLYPAGMNLHSRWIGETLMATTNPATSGLFRARSTQPTVERLVISKRKSPVFDLLSAGPRHRFTILSSRGPLIVHNCILGLGYGMGAPKFAATMLAGAMGGPPVQFGRDLLDSMHVDYNKFINNPKWVNKMLAIPTRLPQAEMLIHCLVAQAFVERYRARNKAIVSFWELCGVAIEAMALGNTMHFGRCGFITEKDAVLLPSGHRLYYPDLSCDNRQTYSYWNGEERTKLYGALFCENLIQAASRDIVAEQMVAYVDTGRKVATMSHDEIVGLAPDHDAQQALGTLLEIMKTAPAWAPGLPLFAEGGIGQRYGACK